MISKESLINSNSVHLGPRTGLPDKILKGDHQRLNPISPGKKIHSPFLFLATVAMLVGCLDCRTKFGTGHQRSKQSLIPIGPVVSEMKIFKISSPFFISSNSGHVGWRSGLSDTILEGDHPRTIPPKFDLNWSSGFRGEDFLVIVDGWTTNAK